MVRPGKVSHRQGFAWLATSGKISQAAGISSARSARPRLAKGLGARLYGAGHMVKSGKTSKILTRPGKATFVWNVRLHVRGLVR